MWCMKSRITPNGVSLADYCRARTDQRGSDDCWPWTGGIDERGYGRVDCGSIRTRAHRAAFFLANGYWASEATDHTCHNQDKACDGGSNCTHRRCQNPAHLADATKRENLLAGRSSSTIAAKGRTQCPAGHPLSGNNLYLRADGRGRDCKKCRAAAEARRRERIGKTCEVCPKRISPRAKRCTEHQLARWSKR